MTRRGVLLVILLLAVAHAAAASADDRLEGIMMLSLSRDFHTRRARIEEALAAYREARDPRREATAYIFLSLLDMNLDEVQSADAHLGEATTRFEAAGDYVGAWLAEWTFAEHERALERQSDQVLAFYERSFAMLEKAKAPSALFSLDALMVVGPVVGLPPAEYEPHGAPPEVHKKNVLQLLEVFTRIGYGAEFLRIGELEKAGVQLRRAKEEAALFGGRLDPPIDRYLGTLCLRQWRLDEARDSYRRALEGLEVLRPVGTITAARLRVEVLRDLSEVEMRSGRMDEALAWNDRALDIVRAAKSEEIEALLLKNRAEMLARAGRFATAEKVFSQALSLAESAESFDMQVSIDLSSAQMNNSRGRHGAAAADVEKSLEVLSRANEPLREPAIWGNLAMAYVQLGADDTARIALERARQLAEKNGRCLDVAAIDLIESTRKFVHDDASLADFQQAVEQWSRTPDVLSVPGSEYFTQIVAAAMGSAPADPQGAVRSGMLSDGTLELLQAAALFSEGRQSGAARELAMKALQTVPDPSHRAAALEIIGGTYAAEGDDDRGIAYFSQAIEARDLAAREARAGPLLSSSVDGASSPATFDLLIGLLVKHRRYEEAFAFAERARARVFLQLLGNSRVSPRGPENTLPAQEAETLRTQMLQWQQQARLDPGGRIDDDLRQARRRYEALMPRVNAANPEYAAMTTVEPLPLDTIRGQLPAGTTLLSYFVTENSAHAWMLDRTSFQYVALPFGRLSLERARCGAQSFRAGGRGVRLVDPACKPATVEELYGRLFAPLRAHIRNRRLIIVPHGVLHYLPFGAFRDPQTKRYLIEDYTITYAPSASSLAFLRRKETPVNGKALVIGAPAGVMPELPGAMREATLVGTKLHSVPKVGAAAKESLLYRLDGGIDLVHIAAHGFYDAETPLFSRIALAAGDGSDGNLEVHEILSDVDLTGVNLVVLSACQTAAGKPSAGDEIVGLTRALLYAGTPGVISTLWDIGDDAAAALMEHFYTSLLNGDPAADALRHAQLQLLHGDYPDPSQWAAFTLNGDPQGRWSPSRTTTAAGK